jgi:hypothetical protein
MLIADPNRFKDPDADTEASPDADTEAFPAEEIFTSPPEMILVSPGTFIVTLIPFISIELPSTFFEVMMFLIRVINDLS